jgi:hypothetical protein
VTTGWANTGWELMRPMPKVNRVEVIDSTGRVYVGHGLEDVHLFLQDDGTTLKIFVKERKE